jgi:hypothetical protein
MMGEEIRWGLTISNLQVEDQANLTLEEINKGMCLKNDVVFALLSTIFLHMVAMFNEIDNLSQPHFEASVRTKLTLPKVETWSPPGLPKL